MYNNITKRFLLFLIGCIGTRSFLAYYAKTTNLDTLKLLGYFGLAISIGFMFIYLTGSRKTGGEVFGEKIWWNDLRPLHSLLYLLFAYFAINKNSNAWIFLVIDVVIGLSSFMYYHYTSGNLSKLFQDY